MKTLKALVIEDSLVVREYLCLVLGQEANIEVISAGDGLRGLELALSAEPDVILTDLELPGMHGLEIIRRVMSARPCPVIVLSAHLDDGQVDMAFKAIEAGAVEVMAKPAGMADAIHDQFRVSLLRTLRIMATVPVVKRYPAVGSVPRTAAGLDAPDRLPQLIAIGASTGGPHVLHQMLWSWTAPFPLPLIIVQHIVTGFEHSFARWLAETGHDVRVAQHGELLTRGRVYVSPASADLRVDEHGRLDVRPHPEGRSISLSTSIDALFESVAQHYSSRAWGVLLTGMGVDGAAGLSSMRERGAVTIAQDSASSTIDGMPAAARERGAASLVMNPGEIATTIQALLGDRSEA